MIWLIDTPFSGAGFLMCTSLSSTSHIETALTHICDLTALFILKYTLKRNVVRTEKPQTGAEAEADLEKGDPTTTPREGDEGDAATVAGAEKEKEPDVENVNEKKEANSELDGPDDETMHGIEPHNSR